jgi:hypothetical protein
MATDPDTSLITSESALLEDDVGPAALVNEIVREFVLDKN